MRCHGPRGAPRKSRRGWGRSGPKLLLNAGRAGPPSHRRGQTANPPRGEIGPGSEHQVQHCVGFARLRPPLLQEVVTWQVSRFKPGDWIVCIVDVWGTAHVARKQHLITAGLQNGNGCTHEPGGDVQQGSAKYAMQKNEKKMEKKNGKKSFGISPGMYTFPPGTHKISFKKCNTGRKCGCELQSHMLVHLMHPPIFDYATTAEVNRSKKRRCSFQLHLHCQYCKCC